MSIWIRYIEMKVHVLIMYIFVFLLLTILQKYKMFLKK